MTSGKLPLKADSNLLTFDSADFTLMSFHLSLEEEEESTRAPLTLNAEFESVPESPLMVRLTGR